MVHPLLIQGAKYVGKEAVLAVGGVVASAAVSRVLEDSDGVDAAGEGEDPFIPVDAAVEMIEITGKQNGELLDPEELTWDGKRLQRLSDGEFYGMIADALLYLSEREEDVAAESLNKAGYPTDFRWEFEENGEMVPNYLKVARTHEALNDEKIGNLATELENSAEVYDCESWVSILVTQAGLDDLKRVRYLSEHGVWVLDERFVCQLLSEYEIESEDS